MALGQRLMRKVTGKSHGEQNAEDTTGDLLSVIPRSIPMRTTHNSTTSVQSTSSTESGNETKPMPYPHQYPPRKGSRLVSGLFASHQSTGSSGGSGSEYLTKNVTPEIIQSGYLMVKKGLLKGYEKRFYFLTAQAPDLYSFRDESEFQEWVTSGHPVRRLPGLPKEAILPMLVCPVLRADRAGESGSADRAIAVISSEDTKCTSVKYIASSPDECEDWIRSFHQIQIAQRTHRTGSRDEPSRGTDNTTPSSSSHGRTPQNGHQSNQSAQGSCTTSSNVSDVSESPTNRANHATSNSSTQSGPTSRAAPPASGNVLLFVPAAGSAISISDSKLQEAKKEMETLVATGAKGPLRSGLDNIQTTNWRYGPPEYVLSDLEYIKGKTRDHDTTPLESYAESCLQTFIMEATHKAHYAEWTSVRHEYFSIQVNDGMQIPGRDIQENDLFGMLHLNDDEVDMDLREGEERKDPRAILSEAFPQGFPMEVLDVYTQPPHCHFSWRHWGRFTGRYRGIRGNGELVELRGFGQMHIDNGRLMNLRLFFKQRDLFEQLNKATASTRRTRQGTVASRAEAPTRPRPASASSATLPTQLPPPQLHRERSDKLSNGDRVHRAPQHVNRTHLYQKFMPQAQGA